MTDRIMVERKNVWPYFIWSIVIFNVGAILGIFGFSCLWSIRELFEQVERVEKGWFPRNPNRK